MFAQKDPDLKAMYDELDAMMAKMKMPPGVEKMPMSGLKPAAPPPAVPAAAK